MDLKIDFTLENGFDLALSNNDLATDSTLKTAIIISLFTDKRVSLDEVPQGQRDPRGFFGDVFEEDVGDSMGSKLWLLEREKHTAEVRELAREYAQEALAWLVEDSIAASVTVTVEYISQEQSRINVLVERPMGRPIDYQFDFVWKGFDAA